MEIIAYSPKEFCLGGLTQCAFVYLFIKQLQAVHYIQVHADGVDGLGGRTVLEYVRMSGQVKYQLEVLVC